MKRKGILLAVLSALVLTLLVPLLAESAETLYFGVINSSNPLPLELRYMPYMAGGTLLLPTPLLTYSESNQRGILSVSYHSESQTLTLFNARKTLHFSLRFNVAYEYESGQQYQERAIQNGNFFYVPAEFVLGYFEYDYSELTSAYGKVVRIKTKPVADDENFLRAIDEQLRALYDQHKGLNPTPSPSPSGATPTPSHTPPPVREVYLTFDDGPNGAVTEKILDTLDEFGMQATFFVQGSSIEKDPGRNGELLRRMLCGGNVIGLHGYTHEDEKFYASPESMLAELEQVNDLLYEAAMIRSRLVRMPYGSDAYLTQAQRDMLYEEGYRFWDWNVDPRDAVGAPSASQIVQRIITGLEKEAARGNAAVLLLHEYAETAKALPLVLQYLKDEGYTLYVIGEYELPRNFKGEIR